MTEVNRAQDTVLARQMQFDADFDALQVAISDYTIGNSRSGSSLLDGIMAFAFNKPLDQLEGVKGNIEILERGLRETGVACNALFALRDLAHGPVFEGYLLMGEVVARNKDQIESSIASDDIEERAAAMHVLASASKMDNRPELDGVWEIMEKNSEVIARDLLADDPFTAIGAFAEILGTEAVRPESPKISDKVFQYIIDRLRSGEITEDKLILILGELAEYRFVAKSNPFYEKHINGFLQSKGIDPISSFLNYWKREGRFEEEIRLNLERISEIENERPGIAKILHDEFGIRHFSRYSARSLIAQFDERDDAQTPYGIVVSAQRDWNGAFRDNENSKQWDNLAKDLEGNYLFRFLEVEDGFDLVKKIRGLDQRYGRSNKISFVFFNAHSNEQLVEFDENVTITTHDLLSGRGDNLRRYFTPEVVVSLIACSSGKKGDFANILAKRFGLKVIASKGLARKVSIKATEQDPVDFKVVFHYGNSRRDKDGRSNGGAVVYDYRSH